MYCEFDNFLIDSFVFYSALTFDDSLLNSPNDFRKKMKQVIIIILISIGLFIPAFDYAQAQKTFCNPVNLDYGFTPIPDFSQAGRHRATADPVIVLYKNNYFLFSTNQA